MPVPLIAGVRTLLPLTRIVEFLFYITKERV